MANTTLEVQLAREYSKKLVEGWDARAVSAKVTNQNYKFSGVKEVTVQSLRPIPSVDFNRVGNGNRYGTPENTKTVSQTMTITQDRSFSFNIEKGDNTQNMNIQNTSAQMKVQNNKVIIPERDKYNLQIMANKPGHVVSAAITASNAYESFLNATIALMEKNVPLEDCGCVISQEFYKFIRLDTNFIKDGDLAMKMRQNGYKGGVEGIPMFFGGRKILPANVGFILANKDATVTCVQIEETKIHEKPQGYSGPLVECRWIHDAFVLDELVDGIYVHYLTGTIVATPTATYVGGDTDTITLATTTTGTTIYYTTDGSDPRRNPEKLTYGSPISTAGKNPGDRVYLKAYAVKNGNIDSALLDQVITIE